MNLYVGTTITRVDTDGAPEACDVIIYFDAHLTHPGTRATFMDPADPPEFDCIFDRAEFDGPIQPEGGPLTEAELATLRTWFDANDDRTWQAANDNHDPHDHSPDDDRDRDQERGWRGLQA